MNEHKGHPKDAPGPFYVQYGCCTACMAPHAEAPDLMGFDQEEHHCYIRHQPQNTGEIYRAIRAVWSSEFGCLRYAGNNPTLLRRLGEAGLAGVCDHAIPLGGLPLLRNHVTFAVDAGDASARAGVQPDLMQLVGAFAHYLADKHRQNTHTLTAIQDEQTRVTFALSWGDDAQEVAITRGEPNTHRVLMAHSPTLLAGSQAVSLILDDWLQRDPGFSAIRWYTAQAWQTALADWQETPL